MQGVYRLKPEKWREDLRKYLMRQEIEWAATHGGAYIEFLQPYCNSAEDLLRYLQHLGFHAKLDGDWINLPGGICVSVKDGFACRK